MITTPSPFGARSIGCGLRFYVVWTCFESVAKNQDLPLRDFWATTAQEPQITAQWTATIAHPEEHVILLRCVRLCFAALALAALGAAQADAQTPTKVKLRLDWKASGAHAPFYLGKQKSFYKDEGLDLDVISGSGSSDAIKQVGSEAVEFGLVDGLVLVQGVAQRVPAKSIAAYYQRTPIVLVSPQAKPVTNPRELLGGVKLGSKKGSATFQGLLALLAANGMTLEQIKLVDIGFGVQPLLVKQVDALMGFSMNELVEAESAGMAVTLMPISDYGVNTYGLTLVANPNFMQQKPEIVKAFMRATLRSVAATTKDPASAVAAVAAAVAEADVKREAKVLEHTIPYWSSKETEARGFGWQTTERWQGTIDVARKLGLIETALKTEDVFVNTYLSK
jgi:NitT/TauT family transport system substrate-binding protein